MNESAKTSKHCVGQCAVKEVDSSTKAFMNSPLCDVSVEMLTGVNDSVLSETIPVVVGPPRSRR